MSTSTKFIYFPMNIMGNSSDALNGSAREDGRHALLCESLVTRKGQHGTTNTEGFMDFHDPALRGEDCFGKSVVAPEPRLLEDVDTENILFNEPHVSQQMMSAGRTYRLIHLLYTIIVTIIGTQVFYYGEGNLALVDAFFIAISSVCGCGLQTVDVKDWKMETNITRHLLMFAGGVVFTSAYSPLFRLWLLRRARPMPALNTPDSSNARAALRLSADRIYYSSVICAVTPLVYLGAVHVVIITFLGMFNGLGMSLLEVCQTVVASFHGAIFLSMEEYAHDPIVVLSVPVACALGFTLFPVVLRDFIRAEWFVLSVIRSPVRSRGRSCTTCNNMADPLGYEGSGQPYARLLSEGDVSDALLPSCDPEGCCVWDRGFRDILHSEHPRNFHPFLFDRSVSVYLGVVWVLITLVQVFPFWLQQWSDGGTLAPFSTSYKVLISLSQAASLRFGGVSFLPCDRYSTAHIAITILCMYVPAIPIESDTQHWRNGNVICVSVAKLCSSRLFWIFFAVIAVFLADEVLPSNGLEDSRLDMLTRCIFEVVSSFSGCGMSLSLKGSPVSFVGSLGVCSKLVIALVMLIGRHHTVDSGFGVNFSTLQGDAPSRPGYPGPTSGA
uniref:Trk system potassium uptake protein n=1 Tax=Trypanosoma vivax (strain Y486) TaxID=1055687 RepID=G0U673_TRYVY|nr:Trk system potassium uptake protein [Trypanosoma vivax Y486]